MRACLKKNMVAYVFNPSSGRQRPADLCDYKESLVYTYLEFQDSQGYIEILSQNEQANKQQNSKL